MSVGRPIALEVMKCERYRCVEIYNLLAFGTSGPGWRLSPEL